VGLKDDLLAEVSTAFRSTWDVRDGRVVPDTDDLALGNQAVRLEDAVVLYADMSGSTALVDSHKWHFAAEIYKSFLTCAARVIRFEGGDITAYDGDRIMAVYLGDSKSTAAARTALKINYCAIHIINPLVEKHYPKNTYRLKHVVGVDRSELHVARTGVRGANDLVWVGQAANYAAKLSDLSSDYPSRITGQVYDHLHESLKVSDGRPMWEEARWTAMNDMRIYRSTWWWPVA
jgi:uridylate cyclase